MVFPRLTSEFHANSSSSSSTPPILPPLNAPDDAADSGEDEFSDDEPAFNLRKFPQLPPPSLAYMGTKPMPRLPFLMAPPLPPPPARTRSNAAPAPIPVPNLMKKSRGRRVPTAAAEAVTDHEEVNLGDLSDAVRAHVCPVAGCGKAFHRGEHLKRHIRSLHTHEKPHRCPHPSCMKTFSRSDNLLQHIKSHPDLAPSTPYIEPPPPGTTSVFSSNPAVTPRNKPTPAPTTRRTRSTRTMTTRSGRQEG